MALPQKYRLSKSKDVEMVFRNGHKLSQASFFMKVTKNSLKTSRLAIVVPKSVSKKATQRNVVKRRLSEAVLGINKLLTAGRDIVIVALPSILRKQFQEIKAEIDQAIDKI